eukprot:TRINITY_DN2845_c0_g1_i5.p1 TRINITY_DN2845_c0_g1~~TRINITY_DN2845_c0_g1_i5.p1  ORF type:complete len:166 (-),score=29.29 TRINITY_DN2845_c0_g1_i5:90-587(-)
MIYILRTKKPLERPGRFYWEMHLEAIPGAQELHVGLAEETFSFDTAYLRAHGTYYIERSGQVFQGNNSVATSSALAANDDLGFALDFEARTFMIFVNGTCVHTFTGMSSTLRYYPCIAARDLGVKISLRSKSIKMYEFGSAKLVKKTTEKTTENTTEKTTEKEDH